MERQKVDQMEKDLEDLVQMVKEEPQGIPSTALCSAFQRNFRRNLNPRAMGYNSVADLVDNVDELLLVNHKNTRRVFHRDSFTIETDRLAVIKSIVDLVKKQPKGYEIQVLPNVYRQKFLKELYVEALGFPSVEALVESQSELIVAQKRVFHVSHWAKRGDDSGSTSGSTTVGSGSTSGSTTDGSGSTALQGGSVLDPQCSFFRSSSSSAPQILTQDQLFRRVLEVMKKFHLNDPPMTLLQTCYLEHFGSELPLAQYVSLYDSWEASQDPPGASGTVPHQPGASGTVPHQPGAFGVLHSDMTVPFQPAPRQRTESRLKDLEDLVKAVGGSPRGMSVKMLRLYYNRNLPLRALGFDSVEDLVSSLDGELIIIGTQVFHRSSLYTPKNKQHITVFSPDEKYRLRSIQNVVDLVKEHPEGVDMKRLMTTYNQRYNQRLDLSIVGFRNVKHMVCTLEKHVFVRRNTLFHVSQRTTPGMLQENNVQLI